MTTPTLKELISNFIVSPDIEVKEPNKIRYVLDKSFFLSWIERSDEDYRFTRMLMDLFVSILERKNIHILVPIDVLLELEKEEKEWVTNKTFLKFLSFVVIIMEINPDEDITSINSVTKLVNKYNEQATSCIVLTIEKDSYVNVGDGLTQIVSPKDLMYTICLMYKVLPKDLQDIYNAWFKKHNFSV